MAAIKVNYSRRQNVQSGMAKTLTLTMATASVKATAGCRIGPWVGPWLLAWWLVPDVGSAQLGIIRLTWLGVLSRHGITLYGGVTTTTTTTTTTTCSCLIFLMILLQLTLFEF